MSLRRVRRSVVADLPAAVLLASIAAVSFLPLTTAAAVSAAPAAAAKQDLVAVMAAVTHELDLQTTLPTAKTPPPPSSDFHLHIPGTLAEWILWGALAVGVVFALFALRDVIPGLRRRPKLKAPAGEVLPQTIEAVERMEETGDEADALARRGLLAEAMHMLLLRSLAELRQRLGVTLADSLTSREILQRLTLPDVGRQALADLIHRVEFVHFGKRPAGPDDYGACRASYEQLIGAMLSPAAGQASATA